MNRSKYFDFIEEKLSHLATRIAIRGGLNILDLHLRSENFYQHFFNLLFGWKLKNSDTMKKNAAGIDLLDTTNNIVVQVSATASRQKIESALAKDLSNYTGYSFKFISICIDAKNLRTKTFANPHKLIFSPAEDIFDVPSLLRFINDLNTEQLKEINDFIKKEFKSEPDPEKVESNLATIIKILSKEDWNPEGLSIETIPYDIEEKISYNQLDTARVLIDDYKIHYHRLEKIYSDFDRQGDNKSLSTLNAIRTEYLALGSAVSPDQCFFSVIKKVIRKIRASANYTPIADEELELCVQILVVDAFIRCKIFKNPLGDTDAHP